MTLLLKLMQMLSHTQEKNNFDNCIDNKNPLGRRKDPSGFFV